MEEKNYILAQSYNKANVQDRLWYVMGADIETPEPTSRWEYWLDKIIKKENSEQI